MKISEKHYKTKYSDLVTFNRTNITRILPLGTKFKIPIHRNFIPAFWVEYGEVMSINDTTIKVELNNSLRTEHLIRHESCWLLDVVNCGSLKHRFD